MVHDKIFTQGTVAATGLLSPEKDRKRNCHGSTSDSSEDGITGDDEKSSNSDEDIGSLAKKVHDITEQVRAMDWERQGQSRSKIRPRGGMSDWKRQMGNL